MKDPQIASWFETLVWESGDAKDEYCLELTHSVERYVRHFDEEDLAKLRDCLLDFVRDPRCEDWRSALTVLERIWGSKVAEALHIVWLGLPQSARGRRDAILEALCRLGHQGAAHSAAKRIKARVFKHDRFVMPAIAWLARVDRDTSISLMAKQLHREYRSLRGKDVSWGTILGPMILNYSEHDVAAIGDVVRRMRSRPREFWISRIHEALKDYARFNSLSPTIAEDIRVAVDSARRTLPG